VVSTSGASQKIHEQYRRNSQLQVLVDNVRSIAELKRRRRQPTPLRVVRGVGEEAARVDARQAPPSTLPTLVSLPAAISTSRRTTSASYREAR
jgi:hypothetical protein